MKNCVFRSLCNEQNHLCNEHKKIFIISKLANPWCRFTALVLMMKPSSIPEAPFDCIFHCSKGSSPGRQASLLSHVRARGGFYDKWLMVPFSLSQNGSKKPLTLPNYIDREDLVLFFFQCRPDTGTPTVVGELCVKTKIYQRREITKYRFSFCHAIIFAFWLSQRLCNGNGTVPV